MGLTFLRVEIGNPANPGVTETVEFLVDPGAIYSVVPAQILDRLGIRPIAEQKFRLPDDSSITRKKGGALFKYDGRVGGADVIFGEHGDATILGVLTLTALGLCLDPIKRELKALPMILAGNDSAQKEESHSLNGILFVEKNRSDMDQAQAD